MKKILITGGSGFIGGNLICLAKKKYKVSATYFDNSIKEKNIERIQFDLSQNRDIKSLLDNIQPDIIIHTAAVSKTDFCEKNRNLAKLINVDATESIALWAKENGRRFIFTSSDMVFDGKKGNYVESDMPSPTSYYAETNVLCEQKITAMDFNSVIIRVAWTYGFGITRNDVFFEMMISTIRENEPVNLFYDQFRTPTLVNNLAEAILELAENDFTGIIHLSGGQRISRWEFGLLTCKILALPINNLKKKSMFDLPGASSRPQDISLSNDLARKVLKVNFLDCSEGLQQFKKTMKLMN
ncbi:SDR family oxidoreductase [candidate division KSB1 bacterium]|nr:SDR family oxidoreductase [candidate division KSB1 bacterium]